MNKTEFRIQETGVRSRGTEVRGTRGASISNIQYPISNLQVDLVHPRRKIAGVWALLAAFTLAAGAAEKEVVELTLGDCVGLALENNLDLKISTVTREMARQDVAAALGGYDPELTVSAKRSHEESAGESAGTAEGALEVLGSETDNDSYEASLAGVTALGGLRYDLGARLGESDGERDGNPFDTHTGRASLTLTQPLLKGFRADGTRYQVAIARGQSDEAALQLEGRIQDILGEVEDAWYSLIEARETVRVQEEAVRLATQLYENNRRKVQIGAMSSLDEKQAESQAAAARADLSSARQAHVEAQNRLQALIYADHRGFRKRALAAAGQLAADPVAVDPPVSGERALEQRPDVREARLALERQGLTVDYQKNQTLPSLDLVGSYGVAASDEDSRSGTFDRMEAADEPFWTAGITLTFPLGNRAARSRFEQSRSAEERMRLEYRQLEESVLVEVDNAVHAVGAGLEKVQATREARDYAEQALEAEQQKLARGKSTSFVVLQLQRDLTAARNSEIRALADYNRQVSALARAEGAMLERHGVEFAGE